MTNTAALIVLAVSIIAMSIAQLLLKARFLLLGHTGTTPPPIGDTVRQGIADPWLWGAVVLIVIAGVCWYLAMLRLPISLMLPLAGLIAPIVSIGAWLLLGEDLTLAKLAAIMTISAGAAWLGWLNT